MFSTRKRQYFVERLGEDVVARMEGSLEEQEKTLQELGTDYKSLSAEYEKELEEQLVDQVAKATQPQVAMIVKEVVKALREPMEAIQAKQVEQDEKLAVLEVLNETSAKHGEKIDHLMETKSAWIEEALSSTAEPKVTPTMSDENVEEAPEEIQKQVNAAMAKEGWLQGFNIGGAK